MSKLFTVLCGVLLNFPTSLVIIIEKYTNFFLKGEIIKKINIDSTGKNPITKFFKIATDRNNIFVLDNKGTSIKTLDKNGKIINEFELRLPIKTMYYKVFLSISNKILYLQKCVGEMHIYDIEKGSLIKKLGTYFSDGMIIYKSYIYNLLNSHVDSYIYVCTLDGKDVSQYHFDYLIKCFIVENDNIYFCDSIGYLECITFKRETKFKWKLKDFGFATAQCIVISHEYIFVGSNDRIQQYDESGELIKCWKHNIIGDFIFLGDCLYVNTFDDILVLN